MSNNSTNARNLAQHREQHSLRRRMSWDNALPNDIVVALWDGPERLLAQGKCLQTKSRTTVARVELAGNAYLLKYHHWAGFWKTLSKSRATSPNRLSFDLGVELANRGVPTPRPLTCIDVRLGPFNRCSFLLTEFVEGTSLYRMLRTGHLDAPTIECLARQVARIWQQLDELHISHNDLKPENFMVDPSGHVWLIDLENARRQKDRRLLRRDQAEDARRLMHVRSWQAIPSAADVFRARLLETSAVKAAIAEPGGATHPLLQRPDFTQLESQCLTVLIPCRGAVEELRGCVEAVRDIANEILLAIPNASYEAWEIAENLADCRTLWCEEFDDHSLRNAIAAARYPWVLIVAPNERVSPDLAKEIQFLLAGDPSEDGYRIERRNYLFGQPILFGDFAADSPVLLVRRDRGVLPTVDGVRGSRLQVGIGQLRCRMFRHFAPSVEQWKGELTEQAACVARDRNWSGEKTSWARALLRTASQFIQSYFVRLGFLDGPAGLRAAKMSAGSEFAKYLKLRQLQRGLRPTKVGPSTVPRLAAVQPEGTVGEPTSGRDRESRDRRAAA
jgi:tRNA A-37 threonylcarbamoyl transferase component Bud32